jgi:hypothetical protein
MRELAKQVVTAPYAKEGYKPIAANTAGKAYYFAT